MGANKFRKGEIDALKFDALPQRCKEIFFEYMEACVDNETHNDEGAMLYPYVVGFEIPEDIKSPIEKILYFAFDLVNFDRQGEDVPGYLLEPQMEIVANGKKYFADFVFNYFGGYNVGYCLVAANEVKLIVECDGHEFHEKTKEQVKRDNERDYNLKMAGYEVLHYSGSQIFNDPIKCAKEIHDYITLKAGGWRKVYWEGENGEV